jgi:hypothetical protein
MSLVITARLQTGDKHLQKNEEKKSHNSSTVAAAARVLRSPTLYPPTARAYHHCRRTPHRHACTTSTGGFYTSSYYRKPITHGAVPPKLPPTFLEFPSPCPQALAADNSRRSAPVKASALLIRNFVINDNICGPTILLESMSID